MTQRFQLTHALQHAMPLPRDNGELIFHSPWESRVFAMAVLLCEKGAYTWKTFNGQFAQCIGEAENHHPEKDAVSAYYQHWRQALEKVLLDKEILVKEQLQARANEFATGQRHHVGSRDTHHTFACDEQQRWQAPCPEVPWRWCLA